MRFDKSHDVTRAAGKGVGRYAVNGVQVAKTATGHGFLAATDSRVLATVPCELDADDHVGVIVAAATVNDARKMAGRGMEPRMALNGAATLADGSTSPYVIGDFPDALRIVPQSAPRQYVDVSMNAKLLLNVAQAMGGECVTIRVGVTRSEECGTVTFKCDGNAMVTVPATSDVPANPHAAIGTMPLSIVMPIASN